MKALQVLNTLADALIARDAKTLAALLHVVNEMAVELTGKPLSRNETFQLAQAWRWSRHPSAPEGTVCFLVDDGGPVPVDVWHSAVEPAPPPAPRR